MVTTREWQHDLDAVDDAIAAAKTPTEVRQLGIQRTRLLRQRRDIRDTPTDRGLGDGAAVPQDADRAETGDVMRTAALADAGVGAGTLIDPTNPGPGNAAAVEDHGADDRKGPANPLVWKIIVGILVLVVGAFGLLKACAEDPKVAKAVNTVAVTPEALALQNACFAAGYFYDANGACYTRDPVGLSAAELTAARVPAPVAGQPAAPVAGQPAAPGGQAPGPAAPGGQAAGAPAPAAEPAAPAAAAAAPAPAPAPAPAAAPTPPPVSIASSAWTLRVTYPEPTQDDPSKTNGDSYSVRFQVDDGVVSGSQYVSNLEKTMTWSGTINPNGVTSNLKADAENQGTFSFTDAHLDSTTSPTLISGKYTQTINNKVVKSGTFRLEKQG